MSFSQEWEERYKENTHLSIWPWSDLISYFMRYVYPINKKPRVLELGCGAGANIPFFVQNDIDYYAIEGSSTIVERLQKHFPLLKDKIVVGDFTKEIPFNLKFDVVIDRASLTQNDTVSIQNTLNMVWQKLNKGGLFIGIDWYSTQHSDFHKGIEDVDYYTRNKYMSGQFKGVGRVHFSDIEHLKLLFSQYQFLVLEQTIVEKNIPADSHLFAAWKFVAKKVGS